MKKTKKNCFYYFLEPGCSENLQHYHLSMPEPNSRLLNQYILSRKKGFNVSIRTHTFLLSVMFSLMYPCRMYLRIPVYISTIYMILMAQLTHTTWFARLYGGYIFIIVFMGLIHQQRWGLGPYLVLY